MTPNQIASLFESPILKKGLQQDEILKLKEIAGCNLPNSYIDLMIMTNGIEGFVSSYNYVLLWSLEKLAEANDGYGINKFAPGFFLFGSNGGDSGFVFDTRKNPMPVLEVPFIEMSLSKGKVIGLCLEDFFLKLHKC
jgi:hypothetical protein